MTLKLYYDDPEITQTEVEVKEAGKDETGFYAILDQTCFYPEGGGQPGDTGTIGAARVLDVQMAGDEIRHYTDVLLEKKSYQAGLDWERRFDHMQQHAGQHVLSAIFDDQFGLKTSSFHLGSERVSIDLDAPEIASEVLTAVEQAANKVIRRHLPITVQWVDDAQAQTLRLRKPPAVSGEIRLVKIEGIDLNACGGTHPKNTADIGQIKIISTEKSKGGTRVYFLCGHRAAAYFRELVSISDELVRQLNAPLRELPASAAALLADKAALEKDLKDVQAKWLEAEAGAFLPDEDGVIEKTFSTRPVKEIQQLARLAIARYPEGHLLFLLHEEAQIRFVCAKGQNAKGDVREVLQNLLAMTDGKGGGNANFAQGGGSTTRSIEEFSHTFRQAVKNMQGIL